jgi:hypothetical protein
MERSAFEKLANLIEDKKTEMTDADYMEMMEAMKSLHDKKLVKTTTPVRQRRNIVCSACGEEGHTKRWKGCLQLQMKTTLLEAINYAVDFTDNPDYNKWMMKAFKEQFNGYWMTYNDTVKLSQPLVDYILIHIKRYAMVCEEHFDVCYNDGEHDFRRDTLHPPHYFHFIHDYCRQTTHQRMIWCKQTNRDFDTMEALGKIEITVITHFR